MPPSEAQDDGRADEARTYRIRPATMSDSPAIRRIRNAAVRESLAIWTSIEQDHAEAEAWLAPMVQRGTALVAHVSGRPQDVVGFAVAGPWPSYEGYARTVEDSVYLSPAVTRPRCACTSAMVSPLSALSRRPARNMVRSST